MTRLTWVRSLVAGVLVALLMLAGGPAVAGPPDQAGPPEHARGQGQGHGQRDGGNPPGKPVTVMTLNVYLGGSINRPVNAMLAAQAGGATPQEAVVALANATEVTRDIVDETDFTVRARLLARDIISGGADVIGLQEVALWRSGPMQLDQIGVPNAEHVDYDFLALLLDELSAHGARYTPAIVGQRADVEAPSFTGSPFDGTIGGSMRDVRMTMHDVILVRDSGSLKVVDTHDEVFDTNLRIGALGVQFAFDRGFQWVDLRTGGTTFRFVNSHLESFSSDIALAQADQMVREATASDMSTVIGCDCNSDPLNDSVKPIDTVPHQAPYDLITSTYTDQWLRWAPASEGFTAGTLGERVNRDEVTWTHRIDMIFGRTASGAPLGVDRGLVTGRDVADRDPATGLWPSDHAGVVLRLRGL